MAECSAFRRLIGQHTRHYPLLLTNCHNGLPDSRALERDQEPAPAYGTSLPLDNASMTNYVTNPFTLPRDHKECEVGLNQARRRKFNRIASGKRQINRRLRPLLMLLRLRHGVLKPLEGDDRQKALLTSTFRTAVSAAIFHPDGDSAVPVVNRLMASGRYDLIVASQIGIRVTTAARSRSIRVGSPLKWVNFPASRR